VVTAARSSLEKVTDGSLKVAAPAREAKLRARSAILIIVEIQSRGNARSNRSIFRFSEYLVKD
jgi:hypothetical protein